MDRKARPSPALNWTLPAPSNTHFERRDDQSKRAHSDELALNRRFDPRSMDDTIETLVSLTTVTMRYLRIMIREIPESSRCAVNGVT